MIYLVFYPSSFTPLRVDASCAERRTFSTTPHHRSASAGGSSSVTTQTTDRSYLKFNKVFTQIKKNILQHIMVAKVSIKTQLIYLRLYN